MLSNISCDIRCDKLSLYAASRKTYNPNTIKGPKFGPTILSKIWLRQSSRISEKTNAPILRKLSDSELNFENHASAICNKVSRKVIALGRIANYMPLEKRRIVMKTFIASQFNYCPLIWMFHSRTINNKINRLHERAIRIVFTDFKSSFEGLLTKDKSLSIYERNIETLALEINKFLTGLSPNFLNNIFHKNISVMIFQNIKNFIPEILIQLDMKLKLFHK